MSSQNKIIIDCQADHLHELLPALRPADRAEVEADSDPYNKIHFLCQQGPAITMLANEVPVAMGGVSILWNGVAENWALTTVLVDRYPVWFHKTVLKLHRNTAEAFGLHRIQSTVRADNEKAVSWHRALGFEKEGLMKGYGMDQADYWMMAKCLS